MPRKTRRYATSVGSISSGTLRSEDLLPAFLDELCYVAPRRDSKLKRDARRAIAALDRGRVTVDGCGTDEFASDVVNELADTLNEFAPPFCYFGSHEGDGADFGFWPDWEQIDELPAFDDTGKPADEKFIGEFRVVSDHGNVEIYVRFANGRVKSLLGVV